MADTRQSSIYLSYWHRKNKLNTTTFCAPPDRVPLPQPGYHNIAIDFNDDYDFDAGRRRIIITGERRHYYF